MFRVVDLSVEALDCVVFQFYLIVAMFNALIERVDLTLMAQTAEEKADSKTNCQRS